MRYDKVLMKKLALRKKRPRGLKLRAKDEKRAKSSDCLDESIRSYKRAQDLLEYCLKEIKRLGLRVVEKKKSKLRLSKMSTTYYREVRVAHGFWKRDIPTQAATLAHELVHARQWRKHGRVRFALAYATSPRFRLAVELQAYRESIRAMRAMGYSNKYIESYINRKPFTMKDAYLLHRVRWDALSSLTRCVLRIP